MNLHTRNKLNYKFKSKIVENQDNKPFFKNKFSRLLRYAHGGKPVLNIVFQEITYPSGFLANDAISITFYFRRGVINFLSEKLF